MSYVQLWTSLQLIGNAQVNHVSDVEMPQKLTEFQSNKKIIVIEQYLTINQLINR